jgi:tRNA-2-methylthio-N6-dimethylallyladenosine synthase
VNLSTDIIVGFPGETEEDFQQTLSMLAEVQYENVYAFIYSPRPFTKALKFTEQVSEDVKSDRLQRILKHQDSLIEKIVSKYEGKVFPVLVEGPSRGNKDLLIARTTHNKVVHFAADPSVIGTTIPVRIAKAMPFVLQGELLS